MIEEVFEKLLSKSPAARKTINVLCTVLLSAVLEVVGLHLILDQTIPGQATIRVHAAAEGAKPAFALENTILEVAPIRFNGRTDLARLHMGSFDQTGTYSSIVDLDWGEHRILVRAYDPSRSSLPMMESYISISPYVRIGLWEQDIYLKTAISP